MFSIPLYELEPNGSICPSLATSFILNSKPESFYVLYLQMQYKEESSASLKPGGTTYLQLHQVYICVTYAPKQNEWLLVGELARN